MSMVLCLCADTVLWDPTSIAMWGSLDFYLPIQQLSVHTIKQTQLTAPLPGRGLGEHRKAQEGYGLPLNST